MAKLFSTKTHGVLDYMTAAKLLILPRAMGWSPEVTALLQGMGAATVVYSCFTRYELGVVKLLPMPAHLALDVLSGLSLCAAAAVLEDESPGVRAALAAIGLFEIAAGLSTESQPRGVGASGSFRTVPVEQVVAPLRARNAVL